jgi:hypothetical protein
VPDIVDLGGYFWDVDYTHQFATGLNRVNQMLQDGDWSINEKKYIYGSLSWFPGAILNSVAKVIGAVTIPLQGVLLPASPKYLKLSCTFRRAAWFVAGAK